MIDVSGSQLAGPVPVNVRQNSLRADGIAAARVRQFADAVEKVRRLRCDLARGEAPASGELARLLGTATEPVVAFDLPWPWGGERFELRDIRALNYIVGPLAAARHGLPSASPKPSQMPPS